MNFFKNVKIVTKIKVLVGILLLAFTGLILYVIPSMDNAVDTATETKLRQVTESAYNVLVTNKKAYDDAKAKYDKEKATNPALVEPKEADYQKKAMNEVKVLRYNEHVVDGKGDMLGYFWINDTAKPFTNMIMHPTRADLDGKVLNDPSFNAAGADKKQNLFNEFVKVVEANPVTNDGFVEYVWPKPVAGGLKDKNGNIVYGPDGKPKMTTIELYPKNSYVKLFKEWNWVIGSGVYIDELNTLKSGFRKNVIILAVSAIVFVALLSAFIITSVRKSTQKLTAHIERLANYDLSEALVLDQKDEMGYLATVINDMSSKIQDLIRKTITISDTLSKSAEQMVRSTDEVQQTSEQVAISISELAKGATEQASSAENSNSSINLIVDGILKIGEDMTESTQLANQAKERVHIGENAIKTQVEKMKESKAVTNDVKASFTELNDKAAAIQQFVGEIKGIADQSNLLALNAAIEAARAGENGKGFAVVANEVRKLAEQSAKSVERIISIIKEINLSLEHSVGKVRNVEDSMVEQEKSLKDAVSAFENITQAVNEITERVNSVAHASTLLNSNAKSASSDINHIAVISEQTAAGTEEVAASTEEQSANIHTIAEVAKELVSVSQTLQSNIRKFTV